MSRPSHRHPRGRHGFTLVELLVATGVFIIGFAAVFTLFLSGMRFRKLADDTTLTATLASSLLTDVYLDSGRIDLAPPPTPGPPGPAAPSQYDGDGLGAVETPPVAPAQTKWTDVPLYAYPGVPGTAYRIAGPPPKTAPAGTGTDKGTGHCCDITATDDPMATALVADVIALCPGAPVANLGELERRTRLTTGNQMPAAWNAFDDNQKATYYENELVARGIALRYRAVLIRQPHWMP